MFAFIRTMLALVVGAPRGQWFPGRVREVWAGCCRHGSRERLLSRVCGTVPYAAPEVLAAAARPYRAAPADLWAAALVLLAMLAGGECRSVAGATSSRGSSLWYPSCRRVRRP